MTGRYSFAVDRQLVDNSIVWNQENIDNSGLGDTINEGYVTAEEGSPTRYLSVLDTTSDISLENLNITLANPKLEVEEPIETYTEETPEESQDQVVVFSVEGSDELYGIQVVQDEEGNLQKYQFQFRRNEDGQLEAIPETITLIPMEEDVPEAIRDNLEENVDYIQPVEDNVQIFVEENNSNEHILPDHVEEMNQELEDRENIMYEHDEIEEEAVDIKPGVLQLQNVKQELQESQIEYNSPDLIEDHETFPSNLENEQIADFQIQEQQIQYSASEEEPNQSEENSMHSEMNVENYEEKDLESEQPETVETECPEEEQFEHVEVRPDMTPVETVETMEEPEELNNDTPMNDSDENDYQIVEGLHITGDVDNGDVENFGKTLNSNILKQALKANKDSPKLIKKDNKLYYYIVQQHPEKENVDSQSLEMSNLYRQKVNPRSVLKSSHVTFQTKNDNETTLSGQEERLNKRFVRCKEAVQAMLFHNFINKTTIPQAPVRKCRLPRKQKIRPVERMDEEIVVQEMMVSSNGFVEAVNAGVNKENLAVTEYVELTDSDDDYDPKKVTRKKKKHRRKRIEITISDDESDTSHDTVIELDETDDETNKEEGTTTTTSNNNNNNTPPKRRRGRPPKYKSIESSSTAIDSPSKKSKLETVDNPTKPEIPCPKCDKTFPSQNSLKTHLQHHNLQSSIKKALPEYKYKCEKCAKTFINNILLKKHMCSKLFNCSVCKKKFSDLSSLNEHKRIHAKEQMVKSTSVAQVSPKKIKPVQTTTTTFKVPKMNNMKCKTCGKLCSSLQNLNVHMKTHREFSCGTCAKVFPSQLLLEKHVRESCVKSPLMQRRSTRMKSTTREERKKSENVTPPRQSKVSPKKKTPLNFQVKCEKCPMVFHSYRAHFRHNVVKHGLQTPDKSVLKKEVVKAPHGGVPIGKKLMSSFAALSCELNYNE